MLLTHKAVNNTAPEYVCDLIRFNVNSTTIRTRASFDSCLLCVRPISKMCANSFFHRSFMYAAPTLWNALNLDIRLLPLMLSKKSQDTSLFKVLCKLILMIYILFVWYFCFYDVYLPRLLCISLYVHCTRIFIYIGYWTLNKYY